MWFVTLPNAAVSAFVAKLILAAWSATEVARYPMVLFPSSAGLKTFRYLMPLVTFPLGAGTEAFAAYTVAQVVRPRFARRACSTPAPTAATSLTTDARFTQVTTGTPLFVALVLVVLVNVIGGMVWYPSMIAKVKRSLSPKKE